MKLSKKDIYLLIGFAGFLAAVLVYFFVYKPNQTETEEIKAQNGTLQEEVNYLLQLKNREEEFTTQTALYEDGIQEMFDQFPSNVTPEDAVQEGLMIQQASGVAMTDLGYDKSSPVYTLMAASIEDMPTPAPQWEASAESEDTGETAEAQDSESKPGKDAVAAMVQPVSYSFTCDLNQFMRAAKYVGSIENRDVIDGLSLSYDSSTGLIFGKIDLNKYYVVGTGKEYEPQTFDVPTGSMNLFSTIVISDSDEEIVPEETEEGTEETDESAEEE